MINDPQQMRTVIALLTAINNDDRAMTRSILREAEADGTLVELAASLGAAFLILFRQTVDGDVAAHLAASGLRVAQL